MFHERLGMLSIYIFKFGYLWHFCMLQIAHEYALNLQFRSSDFFFVVLIVNPWWFQALGKGLKFFCLFLAEETFFSSVYSEDLSSGEREKSKSTEATSRWFSRANSRILEFKSKALQKLLDLFDITMKFSRLFSFKTYSFILTFLWN